MKEIIKNLWNKLLKIKENKLTEEEKYFLNEIEKIKEKFEKEININENNGIKIIEKIKIKEKETEEKILENKENKQFDDLKINKKKGNASKLVK